MFLVHWLWLMIIIIWFPPTTRAFTFYYKCSIFELNMSTFYIVTPSHLNLNICFKIMKLYSSNVKNIYIRNEN